MVYMRKTYNIDSVCKTVYTVHMTDIDRYTHTMACLTSKHLPIAGLRLGHDIYYLKASKHNFTSLTHNILTFTVISGCKPSPHSRYYLKMTAS